jgi:subfamily B ATP-binding cassette protein MsbA
MLRLVRPYSVHVVLAIVFMVLFSFFNLFTMAMISPFLKALFYLDNPAVTTATQPTAEVVAEVVIDTATGQELAPGSVPTATRTRSASEGPTAESASDLPGDQGTTVGSRETSAEDGAPRGDPSSLFDRWKRNAVDWMGERLLQGSRQEALLRIVIVAFFMFLAKNLAGYALEVLMVYVSQSVIRDMRQALFEKMTSLPLAFFHRMKAGELISRATNDVTIAEKCISVVFGKALRDPLMILLYFGTALILSWKLTLLAMVLLPASLVAIVYIGKKVRKYSWRQQEEMANLTSVLQEAVYAIRVIKAFANEVHENRRFAHENRKLFKQVYKINWVMKTSSPLTEQFSAIVGLLLLWYGGSKIFAGTTMEPDLFILFIVVVFSMVRPLKSMGQLNNAVQEGVAAAERVFLILDTPSEDSLWRDGKRLDKISGQVDFRDVSFSYFPDEPVLRNINLSVQPGEVVALVGSSGAGKSTLVDLIPGFHFAQQGQVLIDGHDVHELDLRTVRHQLGVVTQEIILFNDTVRANISYGKQDASTDEIVAAARAANADDFIRDLPQGYDTLIGDRGINLSGGQRQRLSIARAILRNPPLLLLDEATSALDSEAELQVQAAIDTLVQNRTTFVIAHRLSTIVKADRIYVMDAGRIVQEGRHDELLEHGGRYRELYDLQFNA